MKSKKIVSSEKPVENPHEKVSYLKELKIVETFAKEDLEIIEKIKEKYFEPREILDLKLKSEEAAKQSEIKELISYPLIKKNLTFNLPHQQEGALKILRDLDGRALLADEVGLGKTITAGMVLKECIVRGFVRKALILTPPSLVNQWKEELSTKFDLDFKEINKESEWETAEFAIASIDKVKNFNTQTNEFKHDKAHQIYWDIIIIDEAHNVSSRCFSKILFKLSSKYTIGLSATPNRGDGCENVFKWHLGEIVYKSEKQTRIGLKPIIKTLKVTGSNYKEITTERMGKSVLQFTSMLSELINMMSRICD